MALIYIQIKSVLSLKKKKTKQIKERSFDLFKIFLLTITAFSFDFFFFSIGNWKMFVVTFYGILSQWNDICLLKCTKCTQVYFEYNKRLILFLKLMKFLAHFLWTQTFIPLSFYFVVSHSKPNWVLRIGNQIEYKEERFEVDENTRLVKIFTGTSQVLGETESDIKSWIFLWSLKC